ncbi:MULTISPECIES: Gfo/Idh/MocA family oxidoreductase [unclassified Caballeronia]|uniref:Gfo/Idh/MocA family protein n=1 Tax=unclassified Caballeronia TaxID=2646786 RepID=UPI00285B61D9|nr:MULTISPECIES: Gfo/Idh/MocA family oxidoreductase [unclassified Caballeronia]MDR5753259.1 Gfo/Idh/MocA family oxidoreductase [Caballeronia sp. LZ024]MDR5840998.1 Gfo/Idh/MocA family oxidoreductase [Caballeronia sp. LZ031]
METTRIAVAGAGYIGLAHIGVIQANPACTLSAIVDPSPGAASVAQKAGVPLYRSLDELLDKARPDGVLLATPNALHVEHALTCIAAGVPMLLEKPIAPSVAEAETLVAEAERAGATILIGHHRAHSPIMARAKQLIDEGRLGRLVAVMGSAVFFKPDSYFADAPWRSQPGGGPILLNLIHEVHNLRMLCGDIVAVQAFASNATRGFAVEDTVAINLRFANGALGTFMLSDTAASARSWEQTSQENKAYATYPDEDCYVIAGTSGSLSVPTMRLKTYSRAEDRSWWKPFDERVVAVRRDDPLANQIAHFVRVVRGEAEPIVSARDGLQNLRITEAIAKAARTGAIVDTTPA